MISITRHLNSIIEGGKRIIKVIRFGKKDVQTASESGPFGFDSSAPEEMRAIYAQTSNKQKKVIIGFINKNQLASVGETRMFSIDSNGEVVMSLHLKNDGTAEFGGNTDNMVRYSPLNAGLQSQKLAINAELVKIAAGINAIVPASYIPTPISLDVSASKISEIKTSS